MTDLVIQRGSVDVPLAGTTDTLGTAVSSLNSAFEKNQNNFFMSGGPPSQTGTQGTDDMSGALRLSATDTVTFDRQSGSLNADVRMPYEVWEYTGAPGGADEFIVRGRGTSSLNGESLAIEAISGIVDQHRTVAFITGVRSDDTTSADANEAKVLGFMNSASQLFIVRSTINGDIDVDWVVVEFTGSNWTIGYGLEVGGSGLADTGTIDIYDEWPNTDGSPNGSLQNVTNWNSALIIAQGNQDSGDDNVADLAVIVEPGSNNTSVDWEYDSDHATSSLERIMVQVIRHPDFTVTRFSSTDQGRGDISIDITSASLVDLAASSVTVQTNVGGANQLLGRGWITAHLDSLTTCEVFKQRTTPNPFGNRIELQVLRFPAPVTGAVALDGQADAVSTGAGELSVTTPLDGQADAVTTASGELTVTGVLVNLDGQADAVTTAAGELTVQEPLDGQADAVTTASGELTVVSSTVALDGQSDAVTTASGELSVETPLDGQADAVSTASGELTVISGAVALDGQSDAVSTAAGELSVQTNLDGQADGTATASGELTVQSPLDGQSDWVSTASGELTVTDAGVQALDGQADAVSTASGELSVTTNLDGQADAVSAASGELTVQIPIDGQSDWVSAASGELTVLAAGVQLLDGQADGTSTASGELTVTSIAPFQIDGQSDWVSTASGELTVLDNIDPCDPVVAIFDDSPGGLEGDDAALWSSDQDTSDLALLDDEVAFWEDLYAVYDIETICPPDRDELGGGHGGRLLIKRWRKKYKKEEEPKKKRRKKKIRKQKRIKRVEPAFVDFDDIDRIRADEALTRKDVRALELMRNRADGQIREELDEMLKEAQRRQRDEEEVAILLEMAMQAVMA